jgi:predicted HNH restriction endonuclease
MAEWSWKQAVAEVVLEIVNRKRSADFTLHEIYEYIDHFAKLFPRNTNVREKVRQVLQRLRDDEGFLVFQGDGHYALDLAFDKLSYEPSPSDAESVSEPITRTVTRNIRLRNTLLARDVKRRYHCICQLCRVPLPITDSYYYAESHHLRPLGYPHRGPDTVGNIIVLCPNHHVLFDRAVITIIPDTLNVLHRCPRIELPAARLYIQDWHRLDPACLKYHHRRFEESRESVGT